jgi:hypothetical protein
MLPHGQWIPWLSRVGLRQRTAWDYMAVAQHANQWPATKMTIKQFLDHVRTARFRQRDSERKAARAAAAEADGDMPPGIVLTHADCRRYSWPDRIDVIATDPPWSDLESYRWLAGFAAERLRDDGLLLVQCSTDNLAALLALFGKHMTYIWTLAIIFDEVKNVQANGRFRSAWKPVLVFGRGKARVREAVTDGYTVRGVVRPKELHDWQQPVEPWRYWLSRLAAPSSVVADPFTGSGTTAVACRELGLRFVGTEIDKSVYKVARSRLVLSTAECMVE